jgi:ankyrin repeat protein
LAAAMRTGTISGSGRISVSPGPPGAKVQNTEEFCPFKPLIDHGAKVNAKDKDGMSALKWATTNNQAKVVELLKEAGATE